VDKHHAPGDGRCGYAEAGPRVLTELDALLNPRVDGATDAAAAASAGQDKVLRYRCLEPLRAPALFVEAARMLTELRTSPPAP
jgi:hypothetical protein